MSEGLLSLHIEGVDEAALNAFGDVEKGGVFEVFLSLGIKLVLPLVKVFARAPHRFGIGEVAGDEKLEPGHGVEPFAHAEHVLQFVVGQVLVEHGEAVAEVEIGFARIVGREGASSYVVDDGVGDAHDFARPRPKSLRGVMWCATAIIILSAIQRIYVSIHNEVPDRVMEMMPGIIISGIFATFIFSLIPIFVLRRLWKGRRWAYFLTLFGSAFAVFVGALSLQSFISADYFSRLADESLTSRPRDYVVSIVVSDIMGAFLTAFYMVIVVLLLSRSTRMYVAAARLARLNACEQVNAGDGWIVVHQDAETRAHLEEEQTRWEEKEANRRAEEAAAQQYKTTRRTDARRNSRSEQRGYKDTSVYTEEGYRLN